MPTNSSCAVCACLTPSSTVNLTSRWVSRRCRQSTLRNCQRRGVRRSQRERDDNGLHAEISWLRRAGGTRGIGFQVVVVGSLHGVPVEATEQICSPVTNSVPVGADFLPAELRSLVRPLASPPNTRYA